MELSKTPLCAVDMSHTTTETIKQNIREHDMRATSARVDVYRVFLETTEPIGVQGLQDKLEDTPDQATIYRIVHAFLDANIIKEVHVGHDHVDYELTDREHHHHLVCSNCGLIEDIKDCDLPKQFSEITGGSSRFSKINSHELTLFGTCETCDV